MFLKRKSEIKKLRNRFGGMPKLRVTQLGFQKELTPQSSGFKALPRERSALTQGGLFWAGRSLRL